MKYFDIQKAFSKIVADVLNEHCVIMTEHMRSSQSNEVAKVDYVDLAALSARPNHRYRILLENVQETKAGCYTCVEKVIISILYYDNTDGKLTLWNDAGKVVFSKTYYKIDKDYYTCNEQELKAALELRKYRQKVRDSYDEDVVKPVDEHKYCEFISKYVKHKVYRFASDVRLRKESRGRYFVTYKKKNGQNETIVLYLRRT